jgi:preprotein translocase subunit SecD
VNRRRTILTVLITAVVAWGALAGTLAAGWEPKLGLDLQGGFSVVLKAPDGTDGEVLDKAVEIMRDRIESLGSVQEPEISVQGETSILVQLPGITDRERALEAVGTTGELSMRPVLEVGSLPGVSPLFDSGVLTPPTTTTTTAPGDGTTTTTGPDETTTTTTTVPQQVPEGVDPATGLTVDDDPSREAWLLSSTDGFVYHLAPAFLTGAEITGAQAEYGGGATLGGGWVVDPDFTAEGAQDFEQASSELSRYPVGDPRRRLAIVVDGDVFSAPQISEQVAAGATLSADTVVITIGSGENPEAEARDLATILRYGALPTAFERDRVDSVSATLGSDSLRAGLVAGIGGLVLVALAMIAYYRALGLITIVGLSVFGSLLLTVIIFLGEVRGTTLTLAGVTGIIVSIGITSDSYIVYFERIKEEYRSGRPLRSAVDHAFARAFRTILTADTVTFVGSILLWALAIGPVKGFAITLGISTVVDVIVAYFFTRPAVALVVRTRMGERGPLSIKAAMGHHTEQPAGAPA